MTFSAEHIDIFNEMIEMGIGDAAASMNTMIGKHIEIIDHESEVKDSLEFLSGLKNRYQNGHITVTLPFSGTLTGNSALIICAKSATRLAQLLEQDESKNPTEKEKKEAIIELGNVLLNAVMAQFSNLVHGKLDYTVPTHYDFDGPEQLKHEILKDLVKPLVGHTSFATTDREIVGEIHVFANEEGLKDFLKQVA